MYVYLSQAVLWVTVGLEGFWQNVVNTCFRHQVFLWVQFVLPFSKVKTNCWTLYCWFLCPSLTDRDSCHLGPSLPWSTCVHCRLYWARSVFSQPCGSRGVHSHADSAPIHLWPSYVCAHQLLRNANQDWYVERVKSGQIFSLTLRPRAWGTVRYIPLRFRVTNSDSGVKEKLCTR